MMDFTFGPGTCTTEYSFLMWVFIVWLLSAQPLQGVGVHERG